MGQTENPSDPVEIDPGADAASAAREAFANGVEDYFLRRRRSWFLLPSKDRWLILKWFDEGIPLEVVLSGLAEVFDRQAASGRPEPVASISYCRHAVTKRWKDRQLAMVGAAPKRKKKADPANDPAKALAIRFREAEERLAASAPAVAEALARIRPEIERLDTDSSRPLSDREGELIDLERAFVRQLLEAVPEDDRVALEAAAAAPLARLKAPLPPDEESRLREVGFLRAVRHRWLLPRFSLLSR